MMSKSPDGLDAKGAAAAAAEAIDRVERGTNPAWRAFMERCAVRVARARPEFTSQDLEDIRLTEGGPSTHEPRAMGALMRWVRTQEIAERTDQMRRSGRRTNHNRDQRIWRSLICRDHLSRSGAGPISS
jgi:hypothetical protein